MERCPVCRARVKENPLCRRCGSDLTDLFVLEKQAEYMLVRAVQCLQAGKVTMALRFSDHANTLKRTEFGELFSGFLRDVLTR